jgi:hypothetical protein
MRRAIVAVMLLLLPALSGAQRIPPPIIGREPARPAPPPPTVPGLARELAYVRLPYSVESYPLITRFSTSRVGGGAEQWWTSGGMGTRLDYRAAPLLSVTLDLTSSFFGGPVFTETIELGTRLRPDRSNRRVYPFADLRGGYILAHESFGLSRLRDDPYWSSNVASARFAYSHGIGGVAGAGVEYALTRRFSLVGSASVMRSRMSGFDFGGPAAQGGEYTLTAYRYAAGVRFNPVRWRRGPTTLPAASIPARGSAP